MASEADQGERSEEATEQRREDFRKRGQVAQTRELSAVFLLFTMVFMIWFMSNFYFHHLTDLFQQTFGDGLVKTARTGELAALTNLATMKMALLLLPIMAVLWVLGFASTLIQVGFLYNEEALEVKWDRMDPVQGFKKIFSLKALMEGGKAIIKMTAILGLSYLLLKNRIHALPNTMNMNVGQLMVLLGSITVRLLVGVGFFMLVLAGIDYFYQRWDLEKEMRMTKQEVKEEMKSREGDPMVRARIKRIQREFAQRRMMDDVPKADVIVTNPTHIAIALKYDDTMVAPTVVAKGADLVATKIREIAKENGVPIVENIPLARTMFKTIKIGQSIPRELYTAVAEVLSYVYRLKKKMVK